MTVKRDRLGLAFRKALLSTDPDDSDDNRYGAAFLSVLDDLDISTHDAFGWPRRDLWLTWKVRDTK